MYVYTPPNYDRSRRYPVLYLLGGSGELASNWNIDGRAGFIADNLIAEGKALPMIIAMPNNQVVHRSDPKHTELTFPLFEKELRQHIIPLVDKTYSTQANPHGRAIAGLSMGGRHAQLVGFKALDLFGSFGILSAGDPESEKSTPEFLNDPAINKKVDYLFVGLGTHENSRPTGASCSTRFSRSTASRTTTTSAATAATIGAHGARTWSTCCRNCGARNRAGRPRLRGRRENDRGGARFCVKQLQSRFTLPEPTESRSSPRSRLPPGRSSRSCSRPAASPRTSTPR